MKYLLLILLVMLFTIKAQSQVLEHYKAIEHKQDTLLDLKYFKKIDLVIAQKIDSFLLLKKKAKILLWLFFVWAFNFLVLF